MGKNKRIRSYLPGLAVPLKGVVLLVSLLLPDHTSAECQCNLFPVVRQIRGVYIEGYAQQYIQNFTAIVTANLLNQSKFIYNLTAKLSPYIGNQSLGQFTLLGGLYNISADRLASGNFLWLFSSTAATYNCQDQNVNMSTYITRCYFQTLEKQLQELATNWSYPLGVYLSASRGKYSYVSVDYEKNSTCFCSTSSGFSYHIHFEIDPKNLPALYYNRTSIIGKLTKRDVELAVDNATSILFGETYVHSELRTWASPNNSFLCIWLYFKGQYDLWWNSELSNASNTLSEMTGLYLEYLQTRLLVVSKPMIISCTSYNNGTSRSCLTLPVATMTNSPLTNDTIYTSFDDNDPTLQQEDVATNTTIPNTTVPSTIVDSSTQMLINTTSYSNIANTFLPSTVSSTITTTGNEKLATTQFFSNTSNSTATKSPSSTTLNSTNLSTPNGTQQQSNDTVPIQTTPLSQSITLSTIASTLSNLTTRTTPQTFLSSSTKASTKVLAFTTPFDEDPFFKAEVPVVKKIYNDKDLLNRFGGTAQGTWVTEQAFFYTIAIPVVLGILTCSFLCLVCCQMDWIGLSDPKKNQQ